MEFPFTLEGFKTRSLSIRIEGAFSTPVLVVDKVEQDVKVTGGRVTDDRGRPRKLTLKSNLFDAIPKVQVDDAKATAIVPNLTWYEYAWLGLPFVLVVSGGALGGALGAVALMVNARIFRTRTGAAGKYGFTAAVSLAAVMTFLILAGLFHAVAGS